MTTTRFQSFLAGFTFLATGAMPCLGQSTPPGTYVPMVERNIPWPTSSFGVAGDFHRIEFGTYAGGANYGALALVGDQAVYLDDPSSFDALLQVEPSGVGAIASLAPEVPGEPTGMALVVNGDLWLAELDPVNGGVVKSLVAAGPFADLDLIGSGDVDSTGRDDLVGAHGSDVWVFSHGSTGWAQATTFAASGPVQDLVVLDWDGSGAGEIALLLDQSVEIRSASGALITSFQGAASGGFLARLPQIGGASADRLAWSTPLPAPPTSTGDHVLAVLSELDNRQVCGLFSSEPNSLVSAVHPGPIGAPRTDLLTSLPNSVSARLYEGLTNGLYNAGNADWVIGGGQALAPGDGRPAFGDVTGDGVPDFCFGRGATDDFVFLEGDGSNLNQLAGASHWASGALHLVGGVSWLHVELDLPLNLSGHNRVQAYLWRSTDGTDLDQTVVRNYLYTNAPGQTGLVPGGTVNMWMELGDLSLPGGSSGSGSVCSEFTEGWVLSVRLATWDSSEQSVTSAGRKLHAGFAKYSTTAANLIPTGSSGVFALGTNGCEDGKPGISYVPLPSLPPPANMAAPIYGLPMEGPTDPN